MADCVSVPHHSQFQALHEFGGENQLLQDTIPFDDTIAFDDSLMETQMEKLDFDTEVLENSECNEDGKLQPVSGFGEEVVLDSEDEGSSRVGFMSFANRLSVLKTSRKSKRNVLLEGLTEHSDGEKCKEGQYILNGENCKEGLKGALADNENTGGDGNHQQLLSYDKGFPRLNYIGSEEPEQSAQVKALDFVDHFLSSKELDFSPENKPKNTVRKKLSPASGANGPQNLAKFIKVRTSVGKTGTFEWVNDDQHAGAYFFGKRIDASSDSGNCRQRAVTRDQNAAHKEGKGSCSSGHNYEEKSVNLSEVTVSPCSDSRVGKQIPTEMCMTEQVSELNSENNSITVKQPNEQLLPVPSGHELDICSIEGDTPETFNVGFNTQMAAEAMEALSYGLPPCHNIDDVAHQVPQKSHVDGSGGVTESAFVSRKPSMLKGASSNLEGIARNSKGRKRSANKGTLSTPSKYSSCVLLDHDWPIITKKKRSKSLAERLHSWNSTYTNGVSVRKTPKPIMQRRQVENDIKQCENHGHPSIPVENDLLGQKLQGIDAYQMTRSKTKTIENGSDIITHRRKMINAATEGNIMTYRRKRSHVDAKPSKVLNSGGTCTKLWCDSSIPVETDLIGQKLQGIDAHQMTRGKTKTTENVLDIITYRRKMINAATDGNIITYGRKRSHVDAKPSKVLNSGGTCTKLWCNSSAEARNNILSQQKQSELSALTSYLELNAWNCSKRKRMQYQQPRHSNEASKQFTPSTTTVDRKEHYKRPFSKNLPKSSLLKELISLGISESKTDFRCSRKRRDIACVRVLFSQHLDDFIIKQQKKILARLGISLASCLMDATHFIADRFVRTRNMLEAIALGKPVVTPLWIDSCGQASCLIDEKKYILRDAKKEKEIGFSLPVSLARAAQHPLLKDRRVFITANIKPDKETISSLVKALQGQVVEKSHATSGKFPDDLLILSCEEDHAACATFLDKGFAVYSSELLLNGIIIQKLEYERHQLFRYHVKRKPISKS